MPISSIQMFKHLQICLLVRSANRKSVRFMRCKLGVQMSQQPFSLHVSIVVRIGRCNKMNAQKIDMKN